MSEKIPIETRWRIVLLHKHSNLNQREISSRTGVRQNTISTILSKYESTGSVEDLPRSGRQNYLI